MNDDDGGEVRMETKFIGRECRDKTRVSVFIQCQPLDCAWDPLLLSSMLWLWTIVMVNMWISLNLKYDTVKYTDKKFIMILSLNYFL